MYKSNLNIFFNNKILENNSFFNSTLSLEDISYENVDAWEVIAEFVDENTLEKVCGIYKSVDPNLLFFMTVLNNKINIFKGAQGLEKMHDFLSENGYNYLNENTGSDK